MATSITHPDHTLPERNPYELLSRDQVQREFGITRRWLELATHRGEGPPIVKISPRMVRYRRCDLEAWIADHVSGNAAAE